MRRVLEAIVLVTGSLVLVAACGGDGGGAADADAVADNYGDGDAEVVEDVDAESGAESDAEVVEDVDAESGAEGDADADAGSDPILCGPGLAPCAEGSACTPEMGACSDRGVCLRTPLDGCGGFAGAPCPPDGTTCLYMTGTDIGVCLFPDELAKTCRLARECFACP